MLIPKIHALTTAQRVATLLFLCSCRILRFSKCRRTFQASATLVLQIHESCAQMIFRFWNCYTLNYIVGDELNQLRYPVSSSMKIITTSLLLKNVEHALPKPKDPVLINAFSSCIRRAGCMNNQARVIKNIAGLRTTLSCTRPFRTIAFVSSSRRFPRSNTTDLHHCFLRYWIHIQYAKQLGLVLIYAGTTVINRDYFSFMQ